MKNSSVAAELASDKGKNYKCRVQKITGFTAMSAGTTNPDEHVRSRQVSVMCMLVCT